MLVDRHTIYAPDGRVLWVAAVPAGTPVKMPPDPALMARENTMGSVFRVDADACPVCGGFPPTGCAGPPGCVEFEPDEGDLTNG